jgi:hypothetical protein
MLSFTALLPIQPLILSQLYPSYEPFANKGNIPALVE